MLYRGSLNDINNAATVPSGYYTIYASTANNDRFYAYGVVLVIRREGDTGTAFVFGLDKDQKWMAGKVVSI